MATNEEKSIPKILKTHNEEILAEWVQEQKKQSFRQRISDAELLSQSREFLELLVQSVNGGNVSNLLAREFDPLREFLANVSRSRSLQGFSPSETANFIFSFKKPLFNHLRQEFKQDGNALADAIWTITELLDGLGLYTTEAFLKSREEVIMRQQQDMLELSTPVVKLWDGILALPLIGTLDSARTQVVMESLLQMIVETGSEVAIIDITGVPTVDTLVAQHLIKTITAARLMGADCIISGIRPQIAQTIVHLGVDLADVVTKATLADAFLLALRRSGRVVSRASSSSKPSGPI